MMLEWIVSSCFVILAVLAVRAAFGRRISANLRYALWTLVLVRLLVPVQLFTSPVAGLEISYMGAMEALQVESLYVLPIQSLPAAEASGVQKREDGTVFDENSFGYARLEDGGETVRRYAFRVSPLEVLKGIWLAGGGVLLAVSLLSNLHFAARLRRVRKPLKGASSPIPAYVVEGLPSPCLCGLFRPAVYLTPQAAADSTMLRHVKAHELTHYRHLDHLWSVLRGIALAVHWWNPLVWLAVVLSRRDGELACDESVLRRLGDGERKAYGETLLALVMARPGPSALLRFATTMTGGKRSLQERVRRIACKQKNLVSIGIAVVFLLCATVVCAFGRKAEEEESAPHTEFQVVKTPDLDHDGSPDRLTLRQLQEEELTRWELQFTAGSMSAPTWTGEADTSHLGWTAYFLCQREGEDYLLQYTPWVGGGCCEYRYKLFYLTASGEEVAVQENAVEFDLIFDPDYAQRHQYDPQEIAVFIGEINMLLEDSELLINTDKNLQNTFQEEGRLYDSLWWLDKEQDKDLSLLDNLLHYGNYAQDHPDDIWSPLADLLASVTEAEIKEFRWDTTELVRCLREAERGSRFYTWDREIDAYLGHSDVTGESDILYVAFSDGSGLELFHGKSGHVLMILETPEETVSAFYDAPDLYAYMLDIFQEDN